MRERRDRTQADRAVRADPQILSQRYGGVLPLSGRELVAGAGEFALGTLEFIPAPRRLGFARGQLSLGQFLRGFECALARIGLSEPLGAGYVAEFLLRAAALPTRPRSA